MHLTKKQHSSVASSDDTSFLQRDQQPIHMTAGSNARGWAPLATEEPSTSTPEAPSPLQSRERKTALLEVGYILIACCAWLACSTGIIVGNRYIMVELGFSYPMAVAAMGMAVSGIVSYIVCDVLKMIPPTEPFDSRFYFTRIFPVGAAQGLAMWLSNNLYLLLTVAFIEMARSFLPVFTMAALHLSGLETPTLELVKAVGLTAVGCAVSAYGEIHLSGLGLLCIFGNFTLEAGRLVLMQFLLVGCEFHPMQGLKLISPASVLTLCMMSLCLEYKSMVAKGADKIVAANWYIFLAAASLGLCVNLLSNVIIKLSSATTLKVLAAVRGPIIVMSGLFFFHETVTALELVGYTIALAGFAWFQYAKTQQVVQKFEEKVKSATSQ